jgi:polyribonucleotide nucleotidyltransferase
VLQSRENKIGGITAEILTKALDQAKAGRLHLLDLMGQLPAPARRRPPQAPPASTASTAVVSIYSMDEEEARLGLFSSGGKAQTHFASEPR